MRLKINQMSLMFLLCPSANFYLDDTFDVSGVTGETALLFDHLAAQNFEGASIFQNDQEYRATLHRIERFQRQVEQLRNTETNPQNYPLSARGYLAELNRMQLDVREFLWSHPAERTGLALAG